MAQFRGRHTMGIDARYWHKAVIFSRWWLRPLLTRSGFTDYDSPLLRTGSVIVSLPTSQWSSSTSSNRMLTLTASAPHQRLGDVSSQGGFLLLTAANGHSDANDWHCAYLSAEIPLRHFHFDLFPWSLWLCGVNFQALPASVGCWMAQVRREQ